jgi:hypothetical protein
MRMDEPWALEALKNERDYLADGPHSRTTVAAMDWAIREIERLRAELQKIVDCSENGPLRKIARAALANSSNERKPE